MYSEFLLFCIFIKRSVCLVLGAESSSEPARTLACLLRHRPNAYYDSSNGPLFASE